MIWKLLGAIAWRLWLFRSNRDEAQGLLQMIARAELNRAREARLAGARLVTR